MDIYRWVPGGWAQALFHSAQLQSKGQWAQNGTQEVPPEHEKELLYFEHFRALQQAAQSFWSLLWWYSKVSWMLSSAT